MKRLAVAVLPLAALFAGCGGGDDALSGVVGPNPLSDAHSIVNKLRAHGWSKADRSEVQGFLQGLGADDETAQCLVDGFADHFTPEEFSNSTEDDPEVAEVFADCGLELPST